MKTSTKWTAVDDIKLGRVEYFKALNKYIEYYCKRQTYRFWTWRLQYYLRHFNIERDEFKEQLKRCKEVRSCICCLF